MSQPLSPPNVDDLPAKAGLTVFGIVGGIFLTVLVLDVLGIFLGELLHIKALMTASLAVFVYLQAGMTLACIASFPLTFLSRIYGGVRGKTTRR